MNQTRKERDREITLLAKRIADRADEIVELLQALREDLSRRYEEAGLHPMSEEELRLGEH